MEEEARLILAQAVTSDEQSSTDSAGHGSRMAALFADAGQLDPSQLWLPCVVVFELRYGTAVHPDASRRRKLELALKRLIAELIQERIAPLDARAAQQAAGRRRCAARTEAKMKKMETHTC